MIKLIRSASFVSEVVTKNSIYVDDDLIDIDFGMKIISAASERALTKFRLFRQDGVSISTELKGGVIFGVEITGFNAKSWDREFDKFSPPTLHASEVPILSFELDGMSTNATIGAMTIDQEGEFELRWARDTKSIEISFGVFHQASILSETSIFFNSKLQMSGFRISNCEALSI